MGDAKKDFEMAVAAMEAAKSSDGATMVHCYASLSRSVAFILAYMMKTQRITVVEAAKEMKKKWSAVWPNDAFVNQLIEYVKELGITGTPGEMEMKVTTKKSTRIYIAAAKSFFTGLVLKDGSKREPVCVLHITAVGEAINPAVAAAAAVRAEGLATIEKIETSYPSMGGGASPQILITMYHK